MTLKKYTHLFLIIVVLAAQGCKKNKKDLQEETSSLQVSSSPITNVGSSSAIGGGALIYDGGSTVLESGLCWDTMPLPVLGRGFSALSNGAGNYTCSIGNLKPYTVYYVRAYATNANGTAYGNEISFKSADIWMVQAITTPTLLPINCMKAQGNTVYAGTDRGVFISLNEGGTWQSAGLGTGTVVALGISENLVYAGLSSSSIFRSDNNGQTWTNVRSATTAPFIMDLLVDGSTVYRSEYNGIYKSTDQGVTWINTNPSPTYAIQFSRLMKCNNTIYTPSATYTSLYKTSSAGASWETTTDLNFGVYGNYFPDIDYTPFSILFATEKGLYTSGNQGGAWNKINDLPSAQLLISSTGTIVVAATTNADKLFISSDGGNTWQHLSKEGIVTFTTPMGVTDVLICNNSVFLYSFQDKKMYRFRLNF